MMQYLLFNMQLRTSAGCGSLPTCSSVSMVPPTSFQHTAERQFRVQVPPHLQWSADGGTNFSSTCNRVAWQCMVQVSPQLQLCADGATNFSSTCSRAALQGASNSSPVAVCRWCHQLLFNMQQSGIAGCKSLLTCSGVPMVPPTSLQHAAERHCRVQVPPHL